MVLCARHLDAALERGKCDFELLLGNIVQRISLVLKLKPTPQMVADLAKAIMNHIGGFRTVKPVVETLPKVAQKIEQALLRVENLFGNLEPLGVRVGKAGKSHNLPQKVIVPRLLVVPASVQIETGAKDLFVHKNTLLYRLNQIYAYIPKEEFDSPYCRDYIRLSIYYLTEQVINDHK